MSSVNNSCVALEVIESKSSEDTVDDYKKLEEKCEKVLKRIKGRKAKRGRAKKSTK